MGAAHRILMSHVEYNMILHPEHTPNMKSTILKHLPSALPFLRQHAQDEAARFLVAFQRQQLALFRLFQQRAKGAEAVVGLVEAWLAALQRLLDHRAPDVVFRAALGAQSF